MSECIWQKWPNEKPTEVGRYLCRVELWQTPVYRFFIGDDWYSGSSEGQKVSVITESVEAWLDAPECPEELLWKTKQAMEDFEAEER